MRLPMFAMALVSNDRQPQPDCVLPAFAQSDMHSATAACTQKLLVQMSADRAHDWPSLQDTDDENPGLSKKIDLALLASTPAAMLAYYLAAKTGGSKVTGTQTPKEIQYKSCWQAGECSERLRLSVSSGWG